VSTPPLAVLSVVHAGGGGTILTNQDLMRELARTGSAHVLACGARKWTLHDASADFGVIETIRFARPWSAVKPLSDDRLGAFAHILAVLSPNVVHLRSLLGSGPELALASKAQGVVTVVSFHDFLAVCPTIQLLDAESRYCGGQCTASAADCSAPRKWFPDLPRLKDAYVHEWRARYSETLGVADAFVTTSESAAEILARNLPFLRSRLTVIEHGRDAEAAASVARAPADAPIRVVALGAVGAAKGQGLIEALAKLCRAHGDPFEFHVLGVEAGAWANADGIVFHGAYERGGINALLADLAPSFALLAPIWPETYSHTLTEAWMAGLPVLASDIGAVGERVRRHGGGWLAPPNDPAAWRGALLGVSRDLEAWRARAAEIAVMPRRTVADMARDYAALYRTALRRRECVS
jgi:glycosyltransferase involved in cell wall biosynthesis